MNSIDFIILAACFAFCFWWTKRKTELEPGTCECGHERCGHRNGTGKCSVGTWTDSCACQLFIRATSTEEDELTELRRMAGLSKAAK